MRCRHTTKTTVPLSSADLLLDCRAGTANPLSLWIEADGELAMQGSHIYISMGHSIYFENQVRGHMHGRLCIFKFG